MEKFEEYNVEPSSSLHEGNNSAIEKRIYEMFKNLEKETRDYMQTRYSNT